ncbi:hypothetical protein [Sphingomonas bacterium]|uniref:hypothetical protein n=1 Tax=Sphingomonas bacterium TaxID=1895847 RepID=UPI001576D178|nr:hypothetical protein [Sphingomonas bacterium]
MDHHRPRRACSTSCTRVFLGHASFAPVRNITGEPSISLPVGRSGEGLPIGAMTRDGLLPYIGIGIVVYARYGYRHSAIRQPS